MNINDILEIIKIVITIGGFIVAIFQFNKLIKNTKDANDWNRRQLTISVINLPYKEEYIEIRAYLISVGLDIRDENIRYDDWKKDKEKKILNETDNKINQLFNLFESISILIKHGVYDEIIIRDSLLIIFVRYYKIFENFLHNCNQDNNCNGIFCEYLDLITSKWLNYYKEEQEKFSKKEIKKSSTKPKNKL